MKSYDVTIKKKFSACSFAWCYFFSEILQNEIGAFGGNLPLATFGSERVKGIYGSSKQDLLFNTCVGLERLCGVRLKEHVMIFGNNL